MIKCVYVVPFMQGMHLKVLYRTEITCITYMQITGSASHVNRDGVNTKTGKECFK